MIVIVMGVSGCGKSSLGARLAEVLNCRFIEGDDLHPSANRAKMAAGMPLTDEDRWPWLDLIANTAREIDAAQASAVVACSSLRRVYRDRLRAPFVEAGSDLRFLHLAGDAGVIRQRMEMRRGHFMPAGLLDSQLATLEGADAGEVLVEIDVALSPEDALAKAVAAVTKEN